MGAVEVNGYTIEPNAQLAGANLAGANLAGANLSGCLFGGANLSGANLSGANLSDAYFSDTTNVSGANLNGANLSGAYFIDTNLAGAKLAGANLSGANLIGCLSGADLSGVDLTKAAGLGYSDLSGADLSGADLSGADLVSVILTDAILMDAVLKDANLEDANLRGARLTNANLAGALLLLADLYGADLSGANLSGANLDHTNLSRANLSRANMEHSQLFEARLDYSDLSGTHLCHADLEGARGVDVDLTGADLSGANCLRAYLRGARLRGAKLAWANNPSDLGSADLSGADLSGANLSGHLAHANLSGADLSGADLTEADLEGVNLSGADLSGADLSGLASDIGWDDEPPVNLVGADLTGANLSGARLKWADFPEANLTGADLTGADLTGANFVGSDLTGANFRGANLTRASFSPFDPATHRFKEIYEYHPVVLARADLSGADLTGADLSGADLTEVDLTGSDLTGAMATSDTKWPEGFDPGGVEVDGYKIEVLGLSVRSRNALRRVGIMTVGDLLRVSPEELSKVRNLGAVSITEINRAAEALGVRLGQPNTYLYSSSERDLDGVAAEEGEYPIRPFDPLDTYLDSLSERNLDVWLAYRTKWKASNGRLRPTYEEVGTRHGVTRERVRQIISKQDRRMASLLESSDETLSLVEEIRSRLGPVRFRTSWSAVRSLALEVAAEFQPTQEWEGSERAEQRLNVVLAAAGPSRLYVDTCEGQPDESTLGTLWEESFRTKILPDLKAQVQEMCQAELTISPDALSELIAPYGLLPEATDWIATEHLDLQRVGDFGYVPKRSAMGVLVEVVLRRAGEPMTAREILDVLPVRRGERYVGNVLAAGEVFVRTSPKHYGLREWNLETYESIAEEIIQRIERDGGSTPIRSLIEELSTTFGVSKNSVAMYSQTPQFVVEGGEVRLRQPGEFELAEPDLSARQGWWWLDEQTVRHRLRVTHDLLRGSAEGISVGESAALGVQFGESITYLHDSGAEVEIGWPPNQIGPRRSAMRSVVEPLGVSEGDSLFLDFNLKSKSVQIQPTVSGDSTLNGLIKELAGVDISESTDHLQSLADLMGVDRKIEAILVALGARKEFEMAGQVQSLGDPPGWPSREAIFERVREVASDSVALSLLLTEEENPACLAVSVGNPTMVEFALHCFTLGFTGRKSGADSRGLRIYQPGLSEGEKTLLPSPSDLEPLLVGYEPSLDVFVLWDTPVRLAAGGFVQDQLLQVSERSLYRAAARGIQEVSVGKSRAIDRHKIVVCRASALAEGLVRRRNANVERLIGEN